MTRLQRTMIQAEAVLNPELTNTALSALLGVSVDVVDHVRYRMRTSENKRIRLMMKELKEKERDE